MSLTFVAASRGRFASAAFAVTAALAFPSIGLACSGSLRIELRQEGVYALDHAAIAAAQPTLADCRSDELALTHRGTEVPIRIVGDDGGRFAGSARVEWIGEPLAGSQSWFNAYSPVNAYLLSASPGTHARMREAAASGAASGALIRRLHLEEQKLLVRLDSATMQPGDEPDVWYWARLTHADAAPTSFGFDLPDLDRRSDPKTTITLRLRGMSTARQPSKHAKPVDHVVDVGINGRRLTALEWDGRDQIVKTFEVPAALLKPAANVLELRVPKRADPADPSSSVIDDIMFDSADLAYPAGGDLAAGATPVETLAASVAGLRHSGAEAVALYASSGEYQPAASAADGRYRFAASAPGTRIFAVAAERFLRPTNLRAVAAGDPRTAEPGYDYLIVSHPSLIDAIQPLAEFHRGRGQKVGVFDVNALYDQFNGGIVHPSAIRDLIAWGTQHWEVKPRYVLLVGTASFDARGGADSEYNESQADPRTGAVKVRRADDAELAHPDGQAPSRNLVPTWQVPSPEGQSASDTVYVALKDGDFHPTIAIGRFPVVSAQETAAVVKKTIDYATTPVPGVWRDKVMFIANEDKGFQNVSDQIAAALDRQGFDSTRIYADAQEKDNATHQAGIISGLDEGNLLVHFIGHGGRFIWRSGPPDYRKNHDLFTLDDVSRLNNGGRLPMVLSMTCYSGSFDNPNSDTIGERFLRESDRGAVAVFAASWRNSPSPEYSRLLIEHLLTPDRTIGDAIVEAKAKTKSRVLVETYNLFGDPALVLNRPPRQIQVTRSPERWNDRIAVRLPAVASAGSSVKVNWLDAQGKLLQSSSYATAERQFQLAVPKHAEQVGVYAADLKGDWQAVGNLALPKLAAKASPSWFAAWFAAAPAKRKVPVDPKDLISESGFDEAFEPPSDAEDAGNRVSAESEP